MVCQTKRGQWSIRGGFRYFVLTSPSPTADSMSRSLEVVHGLTTIAEEIHFELAAVTRMQ